VFDIWLLVLVLVEAVHCTRTVITADQ